MAYGLGYAPVFSRGNAEYGEDGTEDPVYPACYGDWIISVGACDDDGNRSYYSMYGNGMDFLAPGGKDWGDEVHDIYSCLANSNDSYGYEAGTSMAAPHVTGIISLIESNTLINWDSGDYEQIIEKTCTPLLGGDTMLELAGAW